MPLQRLLGKRATRTGLALIFVGSATLATATLAGCDESAPDAAPDSAPASAPDSSAGSAAPEAAESAASQTTSGMPMPATTDNPDRYTTRGIIEMLPDSNSPMSELQIRHEHITNFRNRAGVIPTFDDGSTGMKAMIMPFPVAEGVSLDAFSVGDKVEFDFEVTWSRPPYELTRIVALPGGTELDFGTKLPEALPDSVPAAGDDTSGGEAPADEED